MIENASAIDLFCGVGGLTRGLLRSGIRVVGGVDLDDTCEFAYEKNNTGAQFLAKNITDRNLSSLLSGMYPQDDLRILVGCAPCQPFSTYTQTNKHRQKDSKWRLINEFLRVIKDLNPEIVSMENVPQLMKQEIFLDFITELEEKLGYIISAEVVNCAEYGVPQSRKRLVLLASKLGPIELVEGRYKKPKTVGQTIRKLKKIEAGEICKKDPLHQARGLTPINLERIKQSKPGGTWHDWDRKLRASCHTKSSGSTYGSVYARMEWNKPAPTITTQFNAYGTGRFGHPKQDRALSLREGALLQTFPQSYQFFPPDLNPAQVSAERIAIHIGNAVPVNLGWAIGRSIVENIKQYR